MSKTILRTISLIMALVLTFGTFKPGQAKSVGSLTNPLTQISTSASQPPSLNATYTNGAMWISSSELMSLPTSGAAWDKIATAAYGSWGTADLQYPTNKNAIYTLAGALVSTRNGDGALRSKVRDAILAAKRSLDQSTEWQSEDGVLSAGRQIGAYVIAADLINLPSYDAVADNEFRSWLGPIRTTDVGTHSRWKNLRYTCENATANWNTFACASRIAASIYLGDTVDVQRSSLIIRALLGERSAYPADAPGRNGYFEHTGAYQPSWACNDATWTGDNPSCVKSGVNVDGVLVEDASRGGGCCVLQGDGVMYSWESLQGLFVSVELLYRTGSYGNPYTWSNNALKRTLDFMQRSGWAMTPAATYVPWLANTRYGTCYPMSTGGNGRIMSWGDWLYATGTGSSIFFDVHSCHWALQYIEKLYSDGITGGCGSNPLLYCPEQRVTRDQMAVFLLKSKYGSSYALPLVEDTTGFTDVPISYWAAAWIKQLAAEGITGGCSGSKYCPGAPVTRAQMAVFLLKSKYGSSYTPLPVVTSTGFIDVPTTYWAAAWIKQLAAEGITGGCGNGNYCPEAPVTRAEMAVMLIRTFSLP
jgi:hypothetical protein